MSRHTWSILFLLGTMLSVGSESGRAQTSRTMDDKTPVQADLVRFDDQTIQVRIDGELMRFQTSRLHSYRVYQGQFHMRLVGGLVLVVNARSGTFDRDTDWITVADTSGAARDGGKKRRVGPGRTPGSRLKWVGETVSELEAQQHEYRMIRDHHKKRMHNWFTEIEQAKRRGSESGALGNANVFKTRDLADAFAGRLTSQIKALNQAEQLARKAMRTNGDEAIVRRCAQSLVELENGHRRLSLLGEALDQNLVENYRTLRGY